MRASSAKGDSESPAGDADGGEDFDAAQGVQYPVTQRGLRTRESLVSAARHVFERDGYLESRLVDITAEAGCSVGTFYNYFLNKTEVLQAVLEASQDEMLNPGAMRSSSDAASPYAVIEASNRAYFQAYERNAKLMRVFDQVAAIDSDFRESRRRRSAAFVERNARAISDLQNKGLADPDLDAFQTSRALSAMVSRLAYYTYCLGETTPLEVMVEVTTRLWANAIRLEIDA